MNEKGPNERGKNNGKNIRYMSYMSVKRYMKHNVCKYRCVFGLFQLETTNISAL